MAPYRGRSASTAIVKPKVHAEVRRFLVKPFRKKLVANDANYALAA